MTGYTSFRRKSISSHSSNRSYTSIREKIDEEAEEEILVFESNLDHFEDAEKEILGLLEMETIQEESATAPVNVPIADLDENKVVTTNKPLTESTESSNRVSPATTAKIADGVDKQPTKDRRNSIGKRKGSSTQDSIRASIRVLVGAKLENNDVTKLGITKRGLNGLNIIDTSSSLRLDTGNIKTTHLSVVMSMLQDPIQCGYLLNFSNKEHNAENLCFIIMVSRFRDAMRQDMSAWPKTWEELDKEFEGKDEKNLLANAIWPSKRLHRSAIQKLIQSIWDNFICDEAVTQICMPDKVFANVRRRILLFEYYGPDIFTEALLDPIKTLNKDVLPRFFASADNADMKMRIDSIKLKVLVSNVNVPPPTDSPILQSVQPITQKRMFTLHEVTKNELLYNKFLTYLEQNMASENLLCQRMISIFEDLVSEGTKKDQTEATNQAWTIYQYFVAPEAPYEVSLHSRHKKELIISLASVHPQMFDELKKSVMSVLSVNFNGYKSTDDYRGLWMIVKAEKDKSKTFLQNLFG